MRKSAKKIQEKYVEKGFFLAEVTPDIKALPNNEVFVTFDHTLRGKGMCPAAGCCCRPASPPRTREG